MRFVVVLALSWCACGSTCPKGQQLLGSDGGTLTCVQAVDCPRLSNTLVCGMYDDTLRDCVGCQNGQCMRFAAGACTP